MIRSQLETLLSGGSLSREQSRELVAALLAGAIDDVGGAALLVAWRAKGETPDELAGALDALLAGAVPFESEGLVVDCCGTGGDGSRSVNVSTAAAFVVAGAGVAVAKHGNRAVSSSCGSADVLAELGVRLDPEPAVSAAALQRAGICYLHAPRYHPGVGRIAPLRRALGVRTLFNLVGPLANPARPLRQLVGVFDPALCRPFAEVLRAAGRERALVVHGAGSDELALHAPSQATLFADGELSDLVIDAAELGLEPAPLEALAGGDARHNAAWLEALLGGGAVPRATRDVVLLNAAATLMVAGAADDLASGLALARESLSGGAAAEALSELVAVSRGAAS